jgi:hypothetical protein
MSGTVCGVLDSYLYATLTAQRNQGFFKMIFEFFERMVTVGNASRVALQWGSGGTGTDWFDGANPFGENAFALYKLLASASSVRTTDLYVLIQWASTDTFGASPGNPGLIDSGTGDGVAIAMAFREDGGNPWAGTTNDDGTDTKAATVWTAGGSVLHVLDRSCSDYATLNGTHVTNKENMLEINNMSHNHTRLHAVGDADSFVIFCNESSSLGSPGSYRMAYGGVYTPGNDFTMDNPYMLFAGMQNAAISLASPGSIVGTYNCNSYLEGGLLSNIPTDKVQTFAMIGNPSLHNLVYQPNMQIAGGTFDRIPIAVLAYEGSTYGYLGQIPSHILAMVFSLPMETVNSAADWAFIGTTNFDNQQFAIPWDGGAAPGLNSTTQTHREL